MRLRDHFTVTIQWRVLPALRRYGRAFRYAIGSANHSDGLQLLYDAESLCGHYALCSISAESVLEDARDLFEPHARLEVWAEEAAARVGSKWSDDGEAGAARDWALDLIREYAKADGVDLVEFESEEA